MHSRDYAAQLACFNQLMARFGPPAPPGGDPSEGVQYIAVGDGLEEEEISEEVTHQRHDCFCSLALGHGATAAVRRHIVCLRLTL